MYIILFLLKNKNSLLEYRPNNKPKLIGLSDGWGLVKTCCAGTGAATGHNRLCAMEIQILNQNCTVKTAFSSKSVENREFWT